MKIKCLIVDDEPLAVGLIEKHIAKLDTLEVVATCNTALKAFELLNKHPIDLLFLDIKMPNMTGIEFLKNLKHPPKTILTTAYRDYALESYELNVIDYLLKPITFERFFKAIDKFLGEKNRIEFQSKVPINAEFILIRTGNKNHRIDLDTILYIESLKDYIKINFSDGKSISAKYKIGDLELELPSSSFLRIHRSFIINTSKITAFTFNEMEVNGVEIPIGASYKDNAHRFLERLRNSK